jgi:hypothetical protein
MAELLEITCDCGYRAKVADGGLFAGVVELFTCDDCREVVDVLIWSSGHRDRSPPGEVEPRCPRCDSARVRRWREDDERVGLCPRCARPATVESIGIAD